VQFGGQTPLKLADALEKAGIPSSAPRPTCHRPCRGPRPLPEAAAQARPVAQPNNGIAYSVEQARLVATDIGFPLVIRPSYVLGGRAMQIIRDEAGLSNYLLGTVPELVPEDIKARYPTTRPARSTRCRHQPAAV
jgi:carbamoyl-phosphate synthase large subunit